MKLETMKKLILIFVLAVLTGCATAPENTSNWRDEGFNRHGKMISEMVLSEKITRLEGAKRMLPVVKTYFPEDALLFGFWSDVALYAEQLQKEEITTEKYNELFSARWDLFYDANVQRQAEREAIQARDRQRQFMGDVLGNMGRSMQRSNPQPINCATTSIPGVLNTSCR